MDTTVNSIIVRVKNLNTKIPNKIKYYVKRFELFYSGTLTN